MAPSATLLDLAYDFHLGAGDNGNVFQIQNNRDAARSASFAYDMLNRLTVAQTASLWGNTYVYDAWGNLLLKNQMTGKQSGEYFQQTADGANRLVGFCYDAAGNLVRQGACGTPDYAYDAESRITTTAGVAYSYDGEGQRVSKSNLFTATSVKSIDLVGSRRLSQLHSYLQPRM